MAQSSRTFRVFVSSTFSDLKAERNALQEKVFPRLRELATAHGCRFQAIDLRWGVSEEAALDQQTMKICLGEIARSQEISPRPNFIVLLGDRYGWQPVPFEIPATEFEPIINNLTGHGERLLVESWYWRDDNAVPAVYCLQPRTDEFVDPKKWLSVEQTLHSILEKEAGKLQLSPDAILKYTASATEQEIDAGALKVEDAGEHVFCFLRDNQNMPEDDSAASFREADPGAAQNQATLKERLKKKLPGNVHEYAVQWQGDGPSLTHLDQLCENLYADLSKVILAESGKLEQIDPLDAEITAHKTFGKERALVFIGRTEILRKIEKYIAGNDPHPMAIWGESGCGKSALMAKAVEQTQQNGQDVLYRFIGATPKSSEGRALLESLCKQIWHRNGADESAIPSEYKDLVHEFSKCLELATTEKPIVIFLDGLDQLSDTDTARDMIWLPASLPPNVRLVVSTLPGESFFALEKKLPVPNKLEVKPMPVEDGRAILDTWFSGIHRKLQENQEESVLGKFKDCGLPLYLKLAFEEARLWKSYEFLPELSNSIPGILRNLFKRLSMESNHGAMLVSRSLGYLAAARNGLSEDELLDVLSMDKEILADFQRRSPKSPKVERMPVVIWSRLFFDLEAYLSVRTVQDATLFVFHHRQMRETVAGQYLKSGDELARHSVLADYFEGKADPGGKQNWQGGSRRGLGELPYHLIKAGLGKENELELIFSDLGFIEAKCKAKMTLELLNDYAYFLNISKEIGRPAPKKIKEFHQFIQNQSHILQIHPELTFQQAANQPPVTAPSQVAMNRWNKSIERRPWLRVVARQVDSLPALISFQTENQLKAAAISFSGDKLAISDGEIKVYEVRSGREIFRLSCTSGSTFSTIAISPDGRLLACAEEESDLLSKCSIWDIDSKVKISEVSGSFHQILTLRFASSGALLGLGGKGSAGGELEVWNVINNEKLWRNVIPEAIVRKIAFFPDNSNLVAGQGDGWCSFWRISDGVKEKIFQAHPSAAIMDICVSSNDHKIATSSTDFTCRIHTVDEDKRSENRFRSRLHKSGSLHEDITFMGHKAPSSAITFLDETHMISGDTKGGCHIWNSVDGNLVASPFSGEGKIISIEVSGNNEVLMLASEEDRTCRVYETKSFSSLGTKRLDEAALMFFPQDTNNLAVLRKMGHFELVALDSQNSGQTYQRELFSSTKLAYAVSPDGRFILYLDPDGHWKLWDRIIDKVDTGKCGIEVGTDAAACISPDGRSIAIFFQGYLELISVNNKQATKEKLPVIVKAMRFQTNETLEIVGINLSLEEFQVENVVFLRVRSEKKKILRDRAGPFGNDPTRDQSGFLFGAANTFIEWSMQPNGKRQIQLWDIDINCRGMREFSSDVKMHNATEDGKWILLSQPSTSMCYILDASSETLPIIGSFPLAGSLISGALQESGDLIALGYKQGGLIILQRTNFNG